MLNRHTASTRIDWGDSAAAGIGRSLPIPTYPPGRAHVGAGTNLRVKEHTQSHHFNYGLSALDANSECIRPRVRAPRRCRPLLRRRGALL
jgi:hypothetical protein